MDMSHVCCHHSSRCACTAACAQGSQAGELPLLQDDHAIAFPCGIAREFITKRDFLKFVCHAASYAAMLQACNQLKCCQISRLSLHATP